MRTEIVQTYRTHDKYIPIFQVTDATAFTNQPDGASIDIVSNDADDAMKVTILYTDKTTGVLEYETLILDGTTPVTTSSENIGVLYGAFLGDIYGNFSSVSAGDITFTTTGGTTPIATITAGTVSIGFFMFYLAGRNVEVENIAGKTWFNSATPTNFTKLNAEYLATPTVPEFASTTNASVQMDGRMSKFLTVTDWISFASDSTGSTVQIIVLA